MIHATMLINCYYVMWYQFLAASPLPSNGQAWHDISEPHSSYFAHHLDHSGQLTASKVGAAFKKESGKESRKDWKVKNIGTILGPFYSMKSWPWWHLQFLSGTRGEEPWFVGMRFALQACPHLSAATAAIVKFKSLLFSLCKAWHNLQLKRISVGICRHTVKACQGTLACCTLLISTGKMVPSHRQLFSSAQMRWSIELCSECCGNQKLFPLEDP